MRGEFPGKAAAHGAWQVGEFLPQVFIADNK
jgi:hypothetical protein